MSEQKDNRGAIWKNDKKEKDTHPDFRGQALIGGVEYWVSAWKRGPEANPKSPSLSFAFTRKDEGGPSPQNSGPDDDIPF